MGRSPRISFILQAVGLPPRIALWIAEAFAEESTMTYLEANFGIVAWLFLILAIGGLIIFPWKSVRNPTSMLDIRLDMIDFSGSFELEPTINITLRVENKSDIDQTMNWVLGKLSYSAASSFPQHRLQHPLIILMPVKIKAREIASTSASIAISDRLVERFRKYMDIGQYTYWFGTLDLDVSATIWGIRRGKCLEGKELPEFSIVPRGLSLEGLQHAL